MDQFVSHVVLKKLIKLRWDSHEFYGADQLLTNSNTDCGFSLGDSLTPKLCNTGLGEWVERGEGGGGGASVMNVLEGIKL